MSASAVKFTCEAGPIVTSLTQVRDVRATGPLPSWRAFVDQVALRDQQLLFDGAVEQFSCVTQSRVGDLRRPLSAASDSWSVFVDGKCVKELAAGFIQDEICAERTR
ncbi:hypothetical protein [Actinomadura pelletieri]|uniref:hypothetical protein n=1 Tax=Actinomadura pelletieri TaxID=111805 RepID=UPI000EB424D5|nr:hypothetical protein [Actinomadura pelletieri]